MHNCCALRVVKTLLFFQYPALAQQLLEELVTFVREGHIASFLIEAVVLFGQLRNEFIDLDIELRAVFRRARNNQRCARLVNQDRVHFVDDGEVVDLLINLLQL